MTMHSFLVGGLLSKSLAGKLGEITITIGGGDTEEAARHYCRAPDGTDRRKRDGNFERKPCRDNLTAI